MNSRKRYFSACPICLVSITLLCQCVCLVCIWGTLLYLHPNDPSTGPRGWALCTALRSIRARAWCLLYPIIHPTNLLSLSLPSFFHILYLHHLPFHVSHIYCSLRTQSTFTNTDVHISPATLWGSLKRWDISRTGSESFCSIFFFFCKPCFREKPHKHYVVKYTVHSFEIVSVKLFRLPAILIVIQLDLVCATKSTFRWHDSLFPSTCCSWA